MFPHFTLKEIAIIWIWSVFCIVCIVTILHFGHASFNREILDRLDAKTADRYHASDAKRDFARIEKELEKLREDCQCGKKKQAKRTIIKT